MNAGGGGRQVARSRLYRLGKSDHILTEIPKTDVSKPTVRSRKSVDERLTPARGRNIRVAVEGR